MRRCELSQGGSVSERILIITVMICNLLEHENQILNACLFRESVPVRGYNALGGVLLHHGAHSTKCA